MEVLPDEQYIVRSIAIQGFWIDVRWQWPQEGFIPVRQALTALLAVWW